MFNRNILCITCHDTELTVIKRSIIPKEWLLTNVHKSINLIDWTDRRVEAELIIVECHLQNSKSTKLVCAVTDEIKEQCIMTNNDYDKLVEVHFESCTILNDCDGCKCGVNYTYFECACPYQSTKICVNAESNDNANKIVKSKLRKNGVQYNRDHINEDEEAAVNDVKWLWHSDNDDVLNDQSNLCMNDTVKCEKEDDSKIVLNNFKSSVCMNDEMIYKKDYEREVVLMNHEFSVCVNDKVQYDNVTKEEEVMINGIG